MSPSKDEEDGVSEESNAVLHAADDLLPHPLGDVHVPHQYHHWSRDKLQPIEAEEGVIEHTLQNTYVKVINSDPRHWRPSPAPTWGCTCSPPVSPLVQDKPQRIEAEEGVVDPP